METITHVDQLVFTPDSRFPAWISQTVKTRLFGDYEVYFTPVGDPSYGPLELTEAAREAITAFLSHGPEKLEEIVPHLWANYRFIQSRHPDLAMLEGVANEDILKHIQPREVSINLDEDGVFIAIEGECSWEPEHGLWLVLMHGKRWVRVTNFDGDLTDGRAWGLPYLDDWLVDPNASLPVHSEETLFELHSADLEKRRR